MRDKGTVLLSPALILPHSPLANQMSPWCDWKHFFHTMDFFVFCVEQRQLIPLYLRAFFKIFRLRHVQPDVNMR